MRALLASGHRFAGRLSACNFGHRISRPQGPKPGSKKTGLNVVRPGSICPRPV
ncbi:hypothetical protein OCAR_4775 [Afipia carboxidovorans OM5]|nr:hypothetical protein OCAR_4775 [Afipia carboxidovorans OM5]